MAAGYESIGQRALSRRTLVRLALVAPLVAACSAPEPEQKAERVFFEAPTPLPTRENVYVPLATGGPANGDQAATPGAQGTPSTQGTPRTTATRAPGAPASTPAATSTPLALAPTRTLGLENDPARAAGAAIFTAPAPRATPERPVRPAPTSLIIPGIGLESRIVRIGTRIDPRTNALVWETAAFSVGHHSGSSNPGEPGNVVLSGHISSVREGDVFRHLPKIKPGDGIIVRTPERDHLYAADSIATVAPKDVHVLEPTDQDRVILITCVPDGVYSHRLIVSAVYV